MTERARIDGVAVSEERFAALLDEMMPAIERTAQAHGRPTYYETLLALTLLYFAQERVDVAVVEVGLGGRLDGTNVLVPVVAAITSVGFDHTDVLGETLEEIALEKAGIAKPGVPLVVAVEDDAAFAVIAEQAREAGAPLIDARAAAVPVENVRVERDGQSFEVRTARAPYAIETRMLGSFQRRNAATAIVAMEQLPDALRPSSRADRTRVCRSDHPGADGGLSGASDAGLRYRAQRGEGRRTRALAARALCGPAFHVCRRDRREQRRRRDLAYASRACRRISSLRRSTRPDAKRQIQCGLLRIAESIGTWGRSVGDPIEALSVARRSASANDVIVVTGSTFLVGDIAGMVAGRGVMRLRGRSFAWGERTYLMAIVNVTPDSFSGDGQTQIDAAIDYAVKQWNAGADMLDIGGESTRPGHAPSTKRPNSRGSFR